MLFAKQLEASQQMVTPIIGLVCHAACVLECLCYCMRSSTLQTSVFSNSDQMGIGDQMGISDHNWLMIICRQLM